MQADGARSPQRGETFPGEGPSVLSLRSWSSRLEHCSWGRVPQDERFSGSPPLEAGRASDSVPPEFPRAGRWAWRSPAGDDGDGPTAPGASAVRELRER